MNNRNLTFIGLILVLILGVLVFFNSGRNSGVKVAEAVSVSGTAAPPIPAVEQTVSLPSEARDNRHLGALLAAYVARQAPALHEGQWINSEPTTLENLRGQSDGPEPTGLRYCMNSVALKFEKR